MSCHGDLEDIDNVLYAALIPRQHSGALNRIRQMNEASNKIIATHLFCTERKKHSHIHGRGKLSKSLTRIVHSLHQTATGLVEHDRSLTKLDIMDTDCDSMTETLSVIRCHLLRWL